MSPDELDHVHELRHVAEVKQARAEWWARIWKVLLLAVVVASFGWVVWNGSEIRAGQHNLIAIAEQTHAAAKSAKDASESARDTLAILKDCLTPGGRCYQRSQANTTDVLGKVKTIFEYVELCGKDPALGHDLHGLDGCVISLIKEHGL